MDSPATPSRRRRLAFLVAGLLLAAGATFVAASDLRSAPAKTPTAERANPSHR